MSKAKLSKKTLKKIYELTTKRDEYLYSMYRVLDEKDIEFKKTPECDFANSTLNLFAKKLNLTLNKEVGLALLNRLILLREDDIVKLFENDKKTEAEIIELRKVAYDFTEKFQMEIQSCYKTLVSFIFPHFVHRCIYENPTGISSGLSDVINLISLIIKKSCSQRPNNHLNSLIITFTPKFNFKFCNSFSLCFLKFFN